MKHSFVAVRDIFATALLKIRSWAIAISNRGFLDGWRFLRVKVEVDSWSQLPLLSAHLADFFQTDLLSDVRKYPAFY
jgi:hypothetical protein